MAGPRSPPPGSRCHPTAAFNLLLGVLHVLLPGFRQGGAQGQVIDPMPSVVELWQAEEGEPMLPIQADAEQDVEEPHSEQSFMGPSGKALHLHPSTVDFGKQLLGLPRVKLLHAYNPSREKEVVVTSVFAATPHFHMSSVQSRVIPPKGKTTFRLIFLPTSEGSMESTLFINTSSHGVLSYPLFGVGISRDSTAVSKMLLQNTYLLFPHIEHIHLPPVQEEITNTTLLQARLKWAVHYKPKQNSCVQVGHALLLQMNLMIRMHGDLHGLGDLRQYILENLFMVFVVTESNKCSGDTTVTVYALNSGGHLVHIQDIQHWTGSGSSSLQFDPVLLPSSTTNFTEVASITCSAAACEDRGSGSAGEDRSRLDSSKTLKACLSYHVTEGYFGIDPSAAAFHIQPHSGASGVWSVWLTNNLEFNIVLNDVFVAREMKRLLKVLNFTGLLTVPPGCWNAFSLKLSTKDEPISLFTNILLATNLGVLFEIPLQIHLTLSKKGSPRFEAIAQCDILSYLGKSETASLRWQESLSLDGASESVDSDLGTELYNQYQRIKHRESYRRNVLGVMQSVQRKQHEEESTAFLLPRLVTELSVLNFSATALRNSTVRYFLLRNPSSLLVTVQLLPVSSYPDPHVALELLRKWFGIDSQTMNLTTAEFRLVRGCTQRELQQEFCAREKSSLEVLQLQLKPWERRRVGVLFTPMDYQKVTTLILIRNNLTVLDAVPVEGVGAREMLKVGGRLPGTGGSLRFKVPESTLMDCRQQLKNSKQILSIRKNFKVENVGPLPVSVSSMKINGYSCQGFGFEVLDCQAFTLPENSSREIGIVFIPDFTSSWVIRELTLVTETDLEFRFTLNVTLPHHLLPLCADGVPGPGWEESFWRMTVLFVSLSLLGVILIAFQQAQYILSEFMKSRHRPNPGLALHQNSHTVDTIGSDSYRGSCKSFVDSCGSPDKGRGKGLTPVAAAPSRNQTLPKNRSAACGHSQKKPKCSFYYNRPKSSGVASASSLATDTRQQEHTVEDQPSSAKEEPCPDIPGDKWTNLNIINKIDTSVQKPEVVLDKEELVLKAVAAVPSPSSDASLKEELHVCMFPKETNVKTLDVEPELREQAFCGLPVPKKLLDNPSPRSPSPSQTQPQAAARSCDGNNQLVSSRNEKLNCEPVNKLLIQEPSVEKPVHRVPQEEKLCRSRDRPSKEEDDVHRMKRSPEKREGNASNMNWNKNRISARKNRKKNPNISARVPEQTEWKHMCTEFERPELRANGKLRSWYPVGNGEIGKTEQKPGRLPAEEETEICYQNSRRKCVKKFSSDSSSDCGSSRGSVRASRGSWGSWSSTSSSDGDKKPILLRQILPSSESMVQNGFPAETQMGVNLSHNLCSASTDMNVVAQFAETLSPTFADVVAEPEKSKGLYPGEDIWPVQPVCLTTGLNYNLENNAACVIQENPSLQNSYIEWSATCDGHRLSNMYGPLHMEDYNSFPEENMNYHTGFPGSEVQNPAFVDPSCQSSWNMNSTPPPPPPPATSVPTAWDPAGYPSSSPYLSSTRSLSPMSGLFGSIWAPQNDMYESYFPVSASSAQAEHVENQAVLCKQEYSSRFNPFHAYMNLDLWTTAANRNAAFPLSRDSGYCGNM